VASGLTGRTEVSQYRLAVHLMLALAIFALIAWTIRRLRPHEALTPGAARLKMASIVILGLVFVQIYFGALVAGLRAGRAFNTWPLIDGAFIPDAARLFFEQPWWRNFFDNTLTVQFSHRMLAYALLAAVVWHAFDAVRVQAGRSAIRGAMLLVAATVLQAVLGILTLLNNVPIDLALAHQAVAMLVLTLALLQVERLSPPRTVDANDTDVALAGATRGGQ